MKLAVNFRLVLYMCGWTFLMLAGAMLCPIAVSLITGDGAAEVFFRAAGAVALFAAALIYQGREKRKNDEIRSRDGLATVGLAWLTIGLLGALPYWLCAAPLGFWDGVFESFSGFSTTGATVISDVEALPPSLMFWRLLTHWLGGMGIIVLMLAVLPVFGLSGVQLFKNESTLGQYRLNPRLAQTAKLLWLIYLCLSLLLWALLMAGGLGWFDALCHAMSTIATGGFSNRNLSAGHFQNSWVEIILTVFMFLGSLNFAMYYLAVKGDWRALPANTECRVFFYIILAAGLLVAVPLLLTGYYDSGPEALRLAYFQVVSVISTTGLTTADWESWPQFSQGVLFVLFFIGGCSGSTSGGMKCVRWVLLFKGIRRTLRQHIHPRAVIPVRLGGQAVPESLMTAVWSFTVIYFLVMAASTLMLAALNIDLLTAFSASASALGNVGLGLGAVGPTENFGHLPGPAKGILSLGMYIGRLEFFSILILFMPEFWRKG
ncbi:MAG: TrkH family potassium uptake protein [Candidatus Adiutrix sp.]|jgi:trk system potassium uptake protein TrkH|nr:TrkH family potassium uptake protein [Candidatus Adiutrix sp.]